MTEPGLFTLKPAFRSQVSCPHTPPYFTLDSSWPPQGPLVCNEKGGKSKVSGRVGRLRLLAMWSEWWLAGYHCVKFTGTSPASLKCSLIFRWWSSVRPLTKWRWLCRMKMAVQQCKMEKKLCSNILQLTSTVCGCVKNCEADQIVKHEVKPNTSASEKNKTEKRPTRLHADCLACAWHWHTDSDHPSSLSDSIPSQSK